MRSLGDRAVLALAAGLLSCWSCAAPQGSSTPPAPHRPAPPSVAPSSSARLELSGPAPGARVVQITLAEAGLDPDAVDATVDPCRDLYQHACGGWIKSFTIPPDTWGYEKVFSAGTERTHRRVREILEGVPAASPTRAQKRLGDFYRACMDEDRVARRGVQPIQRYLRRVDDARTREELAAATADVHPIIDAFFGLGTEPNPTDSTVTVARLVAGGVRGPLSIDDYLSEAPEAAARRSLYRDHAVRVLVDARVPRSEALSIATDAMKVQTALAAAMRHDTTREAEPNILHLGELERLSPGFPWRVFFQAAGLASSSALHVQSAGFLGEMGRLFRSTELTVLKHYVRWRILVDTSYVLGRPFDEERATTSKALQGWWFAEPRWKQCVRTTETVLKDLVTREYVARYFRPETKEAVRAMVETFSRAFGERLGELDWLDEPTRQNARTKLAKIRAKIGYPEEWPEEDFPILPDTFAENVLGPRLERGKRDFARVGGPVDRITWGARTPLETNAFAEALNGIGLPAALLEPPIFDPHATIPVRYGALGFHLGHEMTHCFDPSGSKRDGDGNLRDWWSPETWRRFEQRTRCVERQFSRYEPLPGVHVDGRRTLDENVADLGGLELAFRAYRKARAGADEVTVAGGYTEDQQFFLAHAQNMCVKFHDDDLRRFLGDNPHAPHWLRVDVGASDLPAFSRAFHCEVPKDTCEVW